MGNSLPLDFHPLVFSGEVRPGFGEDNWCHAFCGPMGVVGVFDGCGGSGAKTHSAYGGHSEAYMASRLSSGAFYSCLQEQLPRKLPTQQFVQQVLVPYLDNALQANVPPANPSGLQITGMRVLPSTLATALICQENQAYISVCPIWAGDSRVYVLDASGLSQLTVDDSNQPDPMEGLYDDGTLTNVVCADKPIRLHCRTVRLKPPFMVLAATDGCFGYVSTPMEFEAMILHTMLETNSVAQWEDNLQKLIASFAGDDHTLCLASFGFGSFQQMQQCFRPRYAYLKKSCLDTVWDTPWEDRDTRRKLWAGYRPNYMKYIESEKP